MNRWTPFLIHHASKVCPICLSQRVRRNIRLAYPRGTRRNLIEIALDLFTSGSITEQRWSSWRVVDEGSRWVVKKKGRKNEKTPTTVIFQRVSNQRRRVVKRALYSTCVRACTCKRASPRSLFRSIDLGGVTAVTRFEIPRSFTTRRGVSLTIARRRLISRGPRLRARRIAQQASKRNCDCNDPCPRTVKGRRYQTRNRFFFVRGFFPRSRPPQISIPSLSSFLGPPVGRRSAQPSSLRAACVRWFVRRIGTHEANRRITTIEIQFRARPTG